MRQISKSDISNMIRLPTTLLAMLFCSTAMSVLAQDDSRLLPQSFTSTVAVSWIQDGRVVDLSLTNPNGKWVLQRVALEVRYEVESQKSEEAKPVAKKLPHAPASAPKSMSLADGWLRVLNEPRPEIYPITMELLPGKSMSTHIELKSPDKIASMVILESRGREPTFIERAKSKLF